MPAAATQELREPSVAVYRLVPDEPSAPARESGQVESAEWIDPLLRRNAVWFCQLRWLVVGVLAAAAVLSFFPGILGRVGLSSSPWWPLGAAAVLTSTNLVFVSLLASAGQGQHRSVRVMLWTQIVSDLLVLTAVIHWLGHETPAVPFMYLFHVILACIVFTPRESLAVTGMAAAFYVASLFLESAGWLPRSSVAAPPANGFAAGHFAGTSIQLDVASMLAVWCVIWYLVSRLATDLRSRDHELFLSNRRLQASIEERSQHMLQTTHQLKAPFAAIHAQSQLLLGGYCGVLPPLAKGTVEKIAARCLVLARQIQEMLQLANLRSQGQSAPPSRRVDLAALVEDLVTRVEPAAKQRGVHFEKKIRPATVEGAEDHLTMLIDNLLTNAVNYSNQDGVVTVTCDQHAPGEALVSIRDRGIGIEPDKLPRIFDDYYRTEEAVRHNSGSTGLGLAIVRQVAQKDRVPVTVESAPGWGTRFTVTFAQALTPLPHKPNINN